MRIIFLGDELEINVDSDCEGDYTFLERLSKYLEKPHSTSRKFEIYIKPENFYRYVKIFTDSGIAVKIGVDDYINYVPNESPDLHLFLTHDMKNDTYTFRDSFAITYNFKINIDIDSHTFQDSGETILRLLISKVSE